MGKSVVVVEGLSGHASKNFWQEKVCKAIFQVTLTTMPGVIDFLNDDTGASVSKFSKPLSRKSLSHLERNEPFSKKEGPGDDDDDDDAAFIDAAISKQNMRAGTEAVKKATASRSKGKNKEASGTLSGGGSFQSMGMYNVLYPMCKADGLIKVFIPRYCDHSFCGDSQHLHLYSGRLSLPYLSNHQGMWLVWHEQVQAKHSHILFLSYRG